MKICLYSPYVPKHIGGGEKYLFDVAQTLVNLGHDVSVSVTCHLDGSLTFPSQHMDKDGQVSDHQQIRQKYQDFLDSSLEKVKFIPTPLNGQASFWQKLFWTKQWDVLYYATDGSLFLSLAKRNVLHIQIPFNDKKTSLLNRVKLANWSVKNTNSEFTKKVIEKYWRTKVNFVHYPMIVAPVAPPELLQNKEKIILHVGRFFRTLHSKRQDILVDIFKQLIQEHPQESQGWQLVLIGTIEEDDYFQEVKAKAAGFPISLLQLTRKDLWQYYQRASIYWHATGFGLEEFEEPAKMEHFGISTVEAMTMGCVPIVIGQGGQVEVVGPNLKELLWKTPEECITKTLPMMVSPSLRMEKGQVAQQQAKLFSSERFRQTLEKMIT